MHRARSAFTLALAPVGQQSFASWLLKGANKSRVRQSNFWLKKLWKKYLLKVCSCMPNAQGRLLVLFYHSFKFNLFCSTNVTWSAMVIVAWKTTFFVCGHLCNFGLNEFLAEQRSTGCVIDKMLQFNSCRTIFRWYKFELCGRNVQFMVERSSFRAYGE